MAGAALAGTLLAGCSDGMSRIDARVASLMAEASQDMGSEVSPSTWTAEAVGPVVETDPTDERPPTVNPSAAEIEYVAAVRREAEDVISRLDSYVQEGQAVRDLTLENALAAAIENSREYKFAEEEYVLASLRLLIERHLWGPRFFDEVSAVVVGSGESSKYDTALELVNEFRVTQRLPYGGQVSARLLAQATEDLHTRVAGENVQSADIILDANIPLLRGAGDVARENLIQSERDLVYAAREFEDFRRGFLFAIARDYFDLIVLRNRISNAELQVESFRQVEANELALYRAGRSTPFKSDQSRNQTLGALDRLNADRERFRVALDEFKIRLGLPISDPITIAGGSFDLPVPEVSMEQAVYASMAYRLDLQTQRDQVDDARRNVSNAKNELLGDLDLVGSFRLPTTDEKDRAGLDFDIDDMEYTAGVTYGLPLDREIERLSLRQAEITLERSIRAYDRFRDDIAVSVRAAVRGIDASLFSLEIQQRAVESALRQQASIDADPARADLRDKTDAIVDIADARDGRDDAERNVQVAILAYLLETGQLRVSDQGQIVPLAGME